MRALASSLLLPLAVFAAENPVKIEKGFRADIPLVGGGTLAAAKIMEIGTDSMVVINADGIHTVPFAQLPEEWQRAAGWSRGSQAERESEQRKQKEAADRETAFARSVIFLSAQILQVTDSGLLVSGGASAIYLVPEVVTKEAVYTTTSRTEVSTVNGLDGPRTTTRTVTTPVLVSPAKTVEERRSARLPESFFIRTSTEGYVDGDTWKGLVVPNGRYQYQDTRGAGRTVTAYMPLDDETSRRLLKRYAK